MGEDRAAMSQGESTTVEEAWDELAPYLFGAVEDALEPKEALAGSQDAARNAMLVVLQTVSRGIGEHQYPQILELRARIERLGKAARHE